MIGLMSLDGYLPISHTHSDGLYGEPVKNADDIIIWDSNDESDSFECIIYQTSITQLVGEFVELNAAKGSQKTTDKDVIINCNRLKKKLSDAISMIDNIL